MPTDQIKKLTSEPAIFAFLFTSLLLVKLLTPTALGTEIITIYGYMLLGAFALWYFGTKIGSEVGSVSGNTAKSMTIAGIGIFILFIIYQVFVYFFRQSSLPFSVTDAQATQTVFQTVFQSFTKFGTYDIDFTKSPLGNIFLFAIVIPLTETITISRLYGLVAKIFSIQIGDFRSHRTWALIGIIASLFMYFHLKVRGVNNNLDLAITFLFAITSLYMVGKFREIEPANYTHIGWNGMALIFGR